MPASRSPSPQRALRDDIDSRRFRPAYYLHGEDDFRKEEAVRQLIAAAVDPATRDFNLELRRGGDLDGVTLGSLLATPPMMAERRVVVVRDAGALKKDARAALDAYLDRPASDTVVVLVAPSGTKPDKGIKERALEIDFEPIKPQQVAPWIAQYAASHLGVGITQGAADLLHAAVGPDLPQLASELDKLASYAQRGDGAEIDEQAVAAVVGVRRGETLGDLLDRVAHRDASGALDVLPHVLAQPKTTAVSIVMALATQTLALAWGQGARDEGLPSHRLEGEYFALLKEASQSFTGRPWGEAVKAWTRAADHWSPEALDDALEALLAADVALKESRLSSDEQVLTSLVLTLCGGRAHGAAV